MNYNDFFVRIAQSYDKLDKIERGSNRVEGRIARMGERLDERFDRIDRRFDEIERSLDKMNLWLRIMTLIVPGAFGIILLAEWVVLIVRIMTER